MASWLNEPISPDEIHSHRLRRILVQKKTEFQKAVIADSHSYGRILILDGEMQSAEYDEFIYHESLVHPALLLHSNPQKVLILGAGEGAAAREALKHKTVRQILQIDIDPDVVEFAIRHLGAWHQGSFADPKVETMIVDGGAYVKGTREVFDVIIADLPSPLEGGPARKLYTRKFYRDISRRLSPEGVLALQAGSGHPHQIGLHASILRTLQSVFPVARPYYVYVPSFNMPWSFVVCSQRAGQDPHLWKPEALKRLLRLRLKKEPRYLDGESLAALMRPSKWYGQITRKGTVIRDRSS